MYPGKFLILIVLLTLIASGVPMFFFRDTVVQVEKRLEEEEWNLVALLLVLTEILQPSVNEMIKAELLVDFIYAR